MFCPNCGNELKNPDVRFCGKCGKAVTNNTQSPAPKPKETAVSQQIQTPQTNTAPQSVQLTSVSPQRRVPAPPQTVKAPRRSAPAIDKENLITASLQAALALLYAGIAVILVLLLNIEDTVVLNTLSGEGDTGTFYLSELLSLMISGNEIFNPTSVSSALAVGAYILIYSIPAFALISAVGSIVRKNKAAFHVAFSFMAFICAIYISALIPMVNLLVPDIRQAAALQGSVIVADAGNLSASKIYIFTAVTAVLIIISIAVAVIIGKRRNKK